MRQTKLKLNDENRQLIETFRTKGLHRAREVNRAHILSALDRGISEATYPFLSGRVKKLARVAGDTDDQPVGFGGAADRLIE